MSNPVNTTAHRRLPPRLAAGALALLFAACVTAEHPSKARDAAAYNVQLGIAYLHQGDVALAKDKLDRALAEDPSSADVHSARAMLFERMHNPATADAEFRTSLRLAPHDPQVVNNYAVYLCQNGRTEEGVRRFEGPRIEVQTLRRLRQAEARFLARVAQPRAGAAALLAANFTRHEPQPGLRSSSARACAWSVPGKSSCSRRA